MKFSNAMAALLVVVCVILICACGSPKETSVKDEKQKIRAVKIEHVCLGEANDSLRLQADIKGELDIEVYPELSERVLMVHVALGDKVTQGQKFATLQTGTLDDAVKQTMANLEGARVQAQLARTDLNSGEELYKSGIITESQILALRAADKRATAAVAGLEAALSQSQTIQAKVFITSPVTGVVGNVYIEPGDMTTMLSPAFSVHRFDTIKATAYASDLDMHRLKLGLRAKVTSQAAPGVEKTGVISKISPVVDAISRKVEVEALFDNSDSALRPGMLAELNIHLETLTDIIIIPNTSVLNRTSDGKASIFVFKDGKVARREVRLGLREGEKLQVIEGLSTGESIVTLGQHLLRDQDPVRVVEETFCSFAEKSAAPAPKNE